MPEVRWPTPRIRAQTNTADARTEYLVERGNTAIAWFLKEHHAKLFLRALYRETAEKLRNEEEN